MGTAPVAGAVDLGGSQSDPVTQISPAVSLPVFIDASRLAAIQAAWRARIGSEVAAVPVADAVVAPAGEIADVQTGGIAVVPAVDPANEPEVITINAARQTLTRAEQVNLEAVAVRDRAEELSRRFAISATDEGAPPVPEAAPAAVAVVDDPVAEADAMSSDAAAVAEAPEAPAEVKQVAAAVKAVDGADAAPASMLGGPPIERASSDDAAPVIEEMATKPVLHTKRVAVKPAPRPVVVQAAAPTGIFGGLFSGWGSSDEEAEPKAAETTDTHKMPTELRSMGWNAQP